MFEWLPFSEKIKFDKKQWTQALQLIHNNAEFIITNHK